MITPGPPHPGPIADMRRAFVLATRNTPLPLLTSLIAQSCRSGLGHWQEPDAACARPATHLFEIQFHGLTAHGFTPSEAARNWRTCALKQIEGQA